MKLTVQNKINSVKALSGTKKSSTGFVVSSSSVRIVNDNLSKSIRNEKDAEIFQNDLKIAIKLAKR
nr:hypothetical protein [uncultured Flavobacterium sp.]